MAYWMGKIDDRRPVTRFAAALLLVGLANLGCVSDTAYAEVNGHGAVGHTPIFSSGCTVEKAGSASEPYTIPVTIGDQIFNLVPDTGSSNLIVGSSKCQEQCNLRNVYRGTLIPRPVVPMNFITGGMLNQYAIDAIGVGGLTVTKPFLASVQNRKIGGAYAYPPRSNACYQTRDGVIGLAYGTISVGGILPTFTALAAKGTPNGFTFQICDGYRGEKQKNGHLFLGGYPSKILDGPIQSMKIEPADYYNVFVEEVLIAGKSVNFPQPVNTAPGRPSLPTRTIVDSGTTRIFLNTQENADALLAAMGASGMVTFPPETTASEIKDFYSFKRAIRGAKVNPPKTFQISVRAPGESPPAIIDVDPENLFRQTDQGLAQVGIAPEPGGGGTILGARVFQGNVLMFDRSGGRIGIARGRGCHESYSIDDIDTFFARVL